MDFARAMLKVGAALVPSEKLCAAIYKDQDGEPTDVYKDDYHGN
jgi:hypothetical protein